MSIDPGYTVLDEKDGEGIEIYFDGKPIHEYTQKVLDRNQKPLAPGTEFRFEVRQENLPRGWNYRVPNTEISKIGY